MQSATLCELPNCQSATIRASAHSFPNWLCTHRRVLVEKVDLPTRERPASEDDLARVESRKHRNSGPGSGELLSKAGGFVCSWYTRYCPSIRSRQRRVSARSTTPKLSHPKSATAQKTLARTNRIRKRKTRSPGESFGSFRIL